MADDAVDWSKVRTRCECGRDMVVRQNRENGSRFMGCTNYPECTNTAPLPASAILRVQGAELLPGFE